MNDFLSLSQASYASLTYEDQEHLRGLMEEIQQTVTDASRSLPSPPVHPHASLQMNEPELEPLSKKKTRKG